MNLWQTIWRVLQYDILLDIEDRITRMENNMSDLKTQVAADTALVRQIKTDFDTFKTDTASKLDDLQTKLSQAMDDHPDVDLGELDAALADLKNDVDTASLPAQTTTTPTDTANVPPVTSAAPTTTDTTGSTDTGVPTA